MLHWYFEHDEISKTKYLENLKLHENNFFICSYECKHIKKTIIILNIIFSKKSIL